MTSLRHALGLFAWQVIIVLSVLAFWQWAFELHGRMPALIPDLFDPYFVSRPSEIFDQFLVLSCLK
jgi:NitT/TauT family transport system permease protein